MNNDLISRSALKKALTDAHINRTLTFDIATFNCVMSIIDNAPTVEIDESVIQEVLNKRCMTAVANEHLIALHGNRPQGGADND